MNLNILYSMRAILITLEQPSIQCIFYSVVKGILIYCIHLLVILYFYPLLTLVELSWLEVSGYYLIFFLPYIACSIFLLIPIPVAILSESFRTQRSKFAVIDRLKERDGLFSCFMALNQHEYDNSI